METEVGMGIAQRPTHEGKNGKPAKPVIELNRPIGGLPFVDFAYGDFRFESKRAVNEGNPDFDYISGLIAEEAKEGRMVAASADELRGSWERGEAAVGFSDGKTVAYARVEKMSHQNGREVEIDVLNSDKKIKTVWEVGSVIVAPDLQEKGLSSIVVAAAMTLKLDEVKRGEAVFTSITKVLKYRYALNSASRMLGIDFEAVVHTDYPTIADISCFCKPPFGEGLQLTPNCPARVSLSELRQYVETGEFPTNANRPKCVLFLSRTDIDRPSLGKSLPSSADVFNSQPHVNGKNGASHVSI